MWLVIKYRKSEYSLFKHDIKKVLGNLPLIFRPKFKYQKIIRNKLQFFENHVLGDYLICYHKKFSNSQILTVLKSLRGLKYFLKSSQNNQKEIISFVNYCRDNQGQDGYLKQEFFEFSNIKKGIFLNGPFANMLFNVIENNKTRFKVLIGSVITTITKNSNYLYRPV